MTFEHDPAASQRAGIEPGLAIGQPQLVAEGALLDDRYRLEKLIGRGGTAEVYRGTDQLLSRSVAVKVFDLRLTDLNTVVRQRNEMQVLAGLSHPNLIAVYDARIAEFAGPQAGFPSGRTYLVMELVEGHTLADRLTHGPIPSEQVTQIGATLASVLQVVHGQDLVHRDIKPANILVADSGQIKLGDFGLARILTAEDRLTTGADVMGTAAYFSPEQARAGVVGSPADIYSLGLVLLECLTGLKEFPGEAVAAAVARLLRDPLIPATLPAPWPTLLAAMTSGDPLTRPTASQVRAALTTADVTDQIADVERVATDSAAVADHESPTAAWSSPLTPFLTRPPLPTSRPRRKWQMALAGFGTAIAIAATLIWLTTRPDTDAPTADPTTHTVTTTPDAPSTPNVGPPTINRPSTKRPNPTTLASTVRTTARPKTAASTSTEQVVALTSSRIPGSTTPTSSRNRLASSASQARLTTTSNASPTPDPGNGKGHKTPKPPKKPKK